MEDELVLMAQGSERVYCYFQVSRKTVEKFNLEYGENAFESSKAVLQLYDVKGRKIRSIFIEGDSSYLGLENSSCDIFAKYGKELKGEFKEILQSNIIALPRGKVLEKDSVVLVDTSNDKEIVSEIKREPLKKELEEYLKKQEEELKNMGTVSSN